MRLLACLAVPLVLSQAQAWAAAPGPSPEEQAAAHYGRGLELFQTGDDMPEALREFKAAYALVPRFEALVNIAVAQRKLGEYADAYNTFQRYLAEGGDRIPPERRQQVAEELKDLERLVAHVNVVVEGAPARVELDGVELGESPLPTLHLKAGRHEFRARRKGGAQAIVAPTLEAGQTVSVPLKPRDLGAARPPAQVLLSVVTAPPGAELSVDDVKVGTSPWSSELRRGEHRLRAELDGYLPRTVRLELEGEERTVQIELKKMHWYHHWYVWTVAAVLVAGGATTAVVLATQPH